MEIREELSMAALANLILDKFAQKVLSGKNLIYHIYLAFLLFPWLISLHQIRCLLI